jgi:hypothetical protein
MLNFTISSFGRLKVNKVIKKIKKKKKKKKKKNFLKNLKWDLFKLNVFLYMLINLPNLSNLI